MKNRCFLLTVLLVASLTISSCGKAVRVNAEELSGNRGRSTAETGAVTEAFKTAYADFAFRLFAASLPDGSAEDKLISPLSAMLCLSLIANGAEGETKTEMENVLGLPVPELNRALYAYTEGLMNEQDARLEKANSIWIRSGDQGLTVEEAFLQTLADWYQAEVYSTPFDDSAVLDLNNWVSRHTDGMIKKMLDRPINPNTMMYLVNALVFDAMWEKQYQNDQVRDWVFTDANGQEKNVDGLFSNEQCYLEGNGMKGFAKAYKGTGYYFVGLLPQDPKESLSGLCERLDGEAFLSLWQNRLHTTVKAMIPEFKTEDRTELNSVLADLGMKKMFSPDAEFLPMANYGGESLYVSEVVQKTYLELDRKGTKAAAVTWGSMATKSAAPTEPKEVYLDRPFLYLIVDAQSGLPLFIGAAEMLR